MDLFSKRWGCGALFKLVTLMSRDAQCVACQRKHAVALNEARDADRPKLQITDVNAVLRAVYPEPTLETIYGPVIGMTPTRPEVAASGMDKAITASREERARAALEKRRAQTLMMVAPCR